MRPPRNGKSLSTDSSPDISRYKPTLLAVWPRRWACDSALGSAWSWRSHPPGNLAAYNAYLRGEQISSGVETSDLATLRRALPYYEQAIALDSTFVEAWTQLARARAWIYGGGAPITG